MTPDSRRQALLQRIDELIESPSLVPLLDHYLDELTRQSEGPLVR